MVCLNNWYFVHTCIYITYVDKTLRKQNRHRAGRTQSMIMIYNNETGFLKFYVMGATGIDFGGIAHVKVGVIAHQKI